MTVHLTAAEVRKLGIFDQGPPDTFPELGKKRTTRKQAGGAYRTRCHACGAEFTTQAAEDRHVGPGHHRYELVL